MLIINWKSVASVKELQSLGKLKEVKECVRADTKQKITARSWEELFNKIQSLQSNESISPQPIHPPVPKTIHHDQYFISPAVEYIFYLIELDGETRIKKLKITPHLFKSPKAAKSWRDKISKLIHPDLCSHSKSSEAMMKLNELYQQMIGRE